jgi:ribosome-associated protein
VAEPLASLAAIAATAADAKQGQDTVVLVVGEVLAISDYFVITSAANTRAVRTIAEEIEAQVAAADGTRPTSIEGLDDLRWVLMDYAGFVVHVFLDETRRYYDLERLWADVPRLDWADQAARSG